MKKRLTVFAAAVAAAMTLAGCVVAPAPVYREPILVEPPPPRVEYPGYPPIVGHIWIGGYWTWTGHRHEWVHGRWEAPRPGYRWVEPRWERDGRYWRHQEGRWENERPHMHAPMPAPAPRFERHEAPRPMPEMRVEPPAREMPRRDFDGRDRQPAPPQREMRSPAPQAVPPAPPQREVQRDRGRSGDERRQGGRRGRDDDR